MCTIRLLCSGLELISASFSDAVLVDERRALTNRLPANQGPGRLRFAAIAQALLRT